MTAITPVPVDAIDVPNGRRAIDPNWVEALATDMDARGQQTPIALVNIGKGRFRLIAGGHRLAAQIHRGAKSIDAIVRQPEDYASEAEMKLAEIAENFMRRELSVLDRAMDVSAWREIYEDARGAVKPGRKAKNDNSRKLATNSDLGDLEALAATFAESFTSAAQQALNLSRDGVFRALKIAAIAEPARSLIALLPMADNQSELLALSAQHVDRQLPIANLIAQGEATSVAHAIAIVDAKPAPVAGAPWEKVSERFSRLKEAEQNRFFDLHREAIERWLAKRGA